MSRGTGAAPDRWEMRAGEQSPRGAKRRLSQRAQGVKRHLGVSQRPQTLKERNAAASLGHAPFLFIFGCQAVYGDSVSPVGPRGPHWCTAAVGSGMHGARVWSLFCPGDGYPPFPRVAAGMNTTAPTP